jgi:phage gp29-like protein
MTDVASAHKMRQGGGARTVPADSMQGNVWRPSMVPQAGARVAPLDSMWDFFLDVVPDPDWAVAQDPDIDMKMRQQPDVHAAMTLRELTVASMPVSWLPSDERGVNPELAQKVADYCADVWKKLSNWNDLYRQLQNAVLRGGQGIEFVWALDTSGGRPIPRPVEFYPVDKSRFVFDRLGNMALLSRRSPVWGAYVARNVNRQPVEFTGDTLARGYTAFPTEGGRFVYHKYKSLGGKWTRPADEGFVYWGFGEDIPLYLPVTFDNFALRFRMKWLEKFGTPLTILQYADGGVSQDDVIAVAKALREEVVVNIPMIDGQPDSLMKVDYTEPRMGGHDAFSSFSDNWTKPRVEKILLGGANIMDVGPGGSYASAVNQRDSGTQMVFRYDAVNIDTTINNQMVPYMCQARWPGMPASYYPRHQMAPELQKDKKAEMEIIRMAVEMGVDLREAEVYDILGMTKPKEGEDVLVISTGMEGTFEGFPPAAPPMNAENSERMGELVHGTLNEKQREPIGAGS